MFDLSLVKEIISVFDKNQINELIFIIIIVVCNVITYNNVLHMKKKKY